MQLSNAKQQVSDNIFFSEDTEVGSAAERSADTGKPAAPVNPEQYGRPLVPGYQNFDFSALPKVSAIDIPFFNRLSDLLSVVFPQQMKERFNIHIEAESLKSRVMKYRDFTQNLADDTFVVQSQCLTWNSNFLVTFSRKAINQGLNEYLTPRSSQPGKSSSTSRAVKPLSRMGEQFAQSVALCCFASINQILNKHLSLNMLTRYVEHNVDKAVLVDGREKVLICTIDVLFGEHLTRPMNIVFPWSALGPFLPELDRLSNVLAGQLEEPTNVKNISDALPNIVLDLVASTPEEQVPLKTITALKVGDLLPLPNFQHLQLKVLDELIFKASLGKDGAYHAGQIAKVEYKAKQQVEG